MDDFAGLGGGSHGLLAPIEGTKSMWCGTRPDENDRYLCSWYDAPGYGNGWNQRLTTGALGFTGAIYLSYHIVWDSEPDYDYTRVEYDAGNDTWQEVIAYTGTGDTVASHFLAIPRARTKLRFHFTADGAWSDQDGLYNTDGGCIVDSIRVTDSGALDNFEDFESAAVGANSAGIWLGQGQPGFGNYSGLKNNLTDKDPCGDNFGTQIVFFIGSPNPSSSYPGLYDTPFCTGPGGHHGPVPVGDGSCLHSSTKRNIRPCGTRSRTAPFRRETCPSSAVASSDSPCIAICRLRISCSISGTCATSMTDAPDIGRIAVSSTMAPIWIISTTVNDLSDLVGGDDSLTVALGVMDMCDVWYLVNGNCAAHTPSPWFDNVALYRYRTSGPQWYYRDLDFFQDNFPEPSSRSRATCAPTRRTTSTQTTIRSYDRVIPSCSTALRLSAAASRPIRRTAGRPCTCT